MTRLNTQGSVHHSTYFSIKNDNHGDNDDIDDDTGDAIEGNHDDDDRGFTFQRYTQNKCKLSVLDGILMTNINDLISFQVSEIRRKELPQMKRQRACKLKLSARDRVVCASRITRRRHNVQPTYLNEQSASLYFIKMCLFLIEFSNQTPKSNLGKYVYQHNEPNTLCKYMKLYISTSDINSY